MTEKIISATKANRLFWLGRYAERGYLLLHLLRKAYDLLIDDEGKQYDDFLKKLDVYIEGGSTSERLMAQLYDPTVITSLRSIIEYANDNAIVLRTEILSESFSYIELCRDFIKEQADKKEANITALQPITDYFLAFWGSIDERVHGRVQTLLHVGKLVEHLDMNTRFNYKFYRLEESMVPLKAMVAEDPELFDHVMLQKLDSMMVEKEYEKFDADYKTRLLNCINHLVVI